MRARMLYRSLGVLLVGLIALLLAACRGTIMDGPDMENKTGGPPPSPAPVMEDFAGRWETEDSLTALTIEDGTVTLFYRDEHNNRQSIAAPAELKDGALVPAEGAERLGFYSSVRREGKFLYALDALTGQEDVFAHDSCDFRPENIGDFDGTWLTRDGSVKLVIQDGEVTRYWKDSRSGRYSRDASGEAEFDKSGDRALHPEEGADEMYGLAGYSGIEKRGRLLYASTPVMDARAMEDVFALEGHEDDFPPVPVYVKASEEVTDRHIRSMRLYAGCFNEEVTDEFIFSVLPDCEQAASLDLRVSASRLTGEMLVAGEVYGKSETGAETLLELTYPLTEALEEKLAERLLAADVLAHNPEHDTSDMLCPTVYFILEAEFASGERISMSTSYGVLIGDAAAELAELLLNREQAQG